MRGGAKPRQNNENLSETSLKQFERKARRKNKNLSKSRQKNKNLSKNRQKNMNEGAFTVREFFSISNYVRLSVKNRIYR